MCEDAIKKIIQDGLDTNRRLETAPLQQVEGLQLATLQMQKYKKGEAKKDVECSNGERHVRTENAELQMMALNWAKRKRKAQKGHPK